jgi:hypothetical protein
VLIFPSFVSLVHSELQEAAVGQVERTPGDSQFVRSTTDDLRDLRERHAAATLRQDGFRPAFKQASKAPSDHVGPSADVVRE